MISAPLFRLLFDQLGPAHAEQLLGVKPRVYKRWLNGSTPVPRCAVLALYWESNQNMLTAAGRFSDSARAECLLLVDRDSA